tara:strand:- start:4665 stop:5882 length:1218 start_codon:yes stop_codon:yes gene_type:complete
MISLILIFFSLDLYSSETRHVIRIGEALRFSSSQSIFIENGNILKAKEYGGNIHVVGKKLGSTYIHLGKTPHYVQVLHKKDYEYYHQLKSAIHGKRDLQIEFNGRCSVIKGRLLLWSDYEEIASSLIDQKNQSCKNTYLFLAHMDLLEDAADFLLQVFQRYNLSPPSVSTQPHILIHSEPIDALKHYGFQYNPSKKNLDLAANIETQIFVMEMSRSEETLLGVNWPEKVNFSGKKLLLEEESLGASIHALAKEGSAKVLASPKIRTASGKKGSFMAGGEIPIQSSGYQFAKVTWKSYGILLNVEAKADQAGNIYMDLTVEVSMPNEEKTAGGIPGMEKNRIESQFFLKDREYLVLSGLVKKTTGQDRQGLPLLQKIPVLGLLFSSEKYQKNESELVILVHPKIED